MCDTHNAKLDNVQGEIETLLRNYTKLTRRNQMK